MQTNRFSIRELSIVLCLCVIAASLSIFATIHTIQFQKYGQIDVDSCYINKWINCESTIMSKYALVAGIPIAWIGFLYYIWIGITFLWASFNRSKRRDIITKSFIISLLALLVTLYMLYLMAFKVEVLCPSCILMHTINIFIFLILKRNLALSYRSIPQHLKQYVIDSIGKRANRMAIFENLKYTIAVLLFLAIGFEVVDFVRNQNLAQPKIINNSAGNSNLTQMSYGPKDAPVQFVVFTDFECFYCSQAHKNISTILKEYPEKIHVIIKNFPLPFHERAKPVALAALAAAKQNKYWEYSNLLFANQNRLEDNDLFEYAQRTKLDIERFSTDLKAPELTDVLNQDIEYANQLGINGTPTMFVNGKMVTNGLSEANLRMAVNSLLGSKVQTAHLTHAGRNDVTPQYSQASILPLNIAGDTRTGIRYLYNPLLWPKTIKSVPQDLLDKSKRSFSGENVEHKKLKKLKKNTCDTKKINNVKAPAINRGDTVRINCNLNLSSSDIVTKILMLEGPKATGVTINCNDATLDGSEGKPNGPYVAVKQIGTQKIYQSINGKDMIVVKSELSENKDGKKILKRPENITIKNCNIIGSVRILGMVANGEGPDLKESSRREKSKPSRHVIRARNNAPRNIVFDNVTITGVGRNPVYFAPGVTYSKLINSEVKGKSEYVGIYLDAESAYNTIKNNYIHVDTRRDTWADIPRQSRGWPLMAIDGSTGNKIMNNKFSNLDNGGIYLYRNCGEDGIIRHTTPSHNLIINNIFFYQKGKFYDDGLEVKPAVFLGSRNYGFIHRLGHCDDDDGRPYGSSVSEKDYARHNVVMQNQFYKRIFYILPSPTPVITSSSDDYIKSRNWENNSNNYIDFNEVVTDETVVKNRLAGCYVPEGYRNFILHGESIDVFINENGEPYYPGYKCFCNDGDLFCSYINPFFLLWPL